VLADINVGLLYILAISSLGVYGVVISGWASNSKYPFFSAMRAAAQMISYEVSIGFILISVVLWAKTFNMLGIVEAQKGHIFGLINAFGLNPLLFPIAVLFLISSMAETARAPFDLTEAESELVAGYQTEYSSMSFALFWLGEYANVLLMCTLNAVLFWGGYLPPVDWAPLYLVPGILWLFAKILFFFFVFSWVKATVPRYRYDQLMRLGWKVFLPISLFWVCLVSGYLMWMGHFDHGAKSNSQTVALYSFDCRTSGWRLDKVGSVGEHHHWMLTKPDGVSMQAKTMKIASGLPSEELIQWTDPSGTLIQAFVRENDMIGPFGPDFVEFSAQKNRTGVSFSSEVCKPVQPRTIGKLL
jgi:formate hydrogenlyase subunit 4